MLTANDLLFGMVVPAVIAAAGVLLSLASRRAWVAPIAIGAAFLCGFVGMFSWSSFRPTDSLEWLWLVGVSAALLGVAQALWRIPIGLNAALVLVISTGSAWLLLRPLVPHTWNERQATMWISALAAAITAAWIGLRVL